MSCFDYHHYHSSRLNILGITNTRFLFQCQISLAFCSQNWVVSSESDISKRKEYLIFELTKSDGNQKKNQFEIDIVKISPEKEEK